MSTPDVNTLRALSQLQRGPVRARLDERLKEIDKQLRWAEGDIYRVLQGRAQELEEMAALIDGADELIKKARAAQEPRIPMRHAF